MSSEDNRVNRRTVIAGLGSAAAAGAVGVSMSGSVAAQEGMEVNVSAPDGDIDTATGNLQWLAVGMQGAVTFENYSDDASSFDWRDELQVEYQDDDGNWQTITGGENGDRNLIYEAEGRSFAAFPRPDDTAEADGSDGHITFHIPNPDGSGTSYSGGSAGGDIDNDPGASWILIRDGNSSEWDTSGYSSVDETYGLPEEAADATEIPAPDDGEGRTVRVTLWKEVTLYSDEGATEELFTVPEDGSPTTQFEFDLNNLAGNESLEGEGEAAGGGN